MVKKVIKSYCFNLYYFLIKVVWFDYQGLLKYWDFLCIFIQGEFFIGLGVYVWFEGYLM